MSMMAMASFTKLILLTLVINTTTTPLTAAGSCSLSYLCNAFSDSTTCNTSLVGLGVQDSSIASRLVLQGRPVARWHAVAILVQRPFHVTTIGGNRKDGACPNRSPGVVGHHLRGGSAALGRVEGVGAHHGPPEAIAGEGEVHQRLGRVAEQIRGPHLLNCRGLEESRLDIAMIWNKRENFPMQLKKFQYNYKNSNTFKKNSNTIKKIPIKLQKLRIFQYNCAVPSLELRMYKKRQFSYLILKKNIISFIFAYIFK